MKTICLLLAMLTFIMVGSAVSKADQIDLAKALVGKWEGEIARGQMDKGWNYGRTLVIGQVREQDGKWIVERARWGVTGMGLAPVQVTLGVDGGEPTLEFDIPAGQVKNSAKLGLIKEGVLAGVLHLTRVGFKNDNMRPMTLKKVE
jgi:hypothetical protein